MTMKRLLLIAIALTSLNVAVFGQALPESDPLLPEDYDPDEFPGWAWDLRRFEVVTIGSFPLSFLATSLIYDFSYWAASGFDPLSGMGTKRTDQDIAIMVGIAAGTSLVIATIDLILGKTHESREQRLEESGESGTIPSGTP